jgi:hypothetical protein
LKVSTIAVRRQLVDMPSVHSASLPPALSSPSQLASQSRQSIPAIASSSRALLQATPEASYSTGHCFSVGSVYKVGPTGVKRSRGHAVYAAVGQGVVIVDVSTSQALP